MAQTQTHDWYSIYTFLLVSICASNSRQLNYLLDYLGHFVQYPDMAVGTAILLHSPAGSGKTFFTSLLRHIFRDSYTEKLVMHDHAHQGILSIQELNDHSVDFVKSAITLSCLRAIISSNEPPQYSLNSGARRFAIIRGAQASADFDYLAHRIYEVNEASAFLHHLQRRNVGGFVPYDLPQCYTRNV